MAQDYPLPRFHFQVDWGGAKISFSEVTGLAMEREKIEYRHSDSKDFNKIAMPGLVKNNALTLKRPEVVYDLPAGGRRLIQRASGYRHTFNAGVETLHNDELTGERPGHVVRGAQTAV